MLEVVRDYISFFKFYVSDSHYRNTIVPLCLEIAKNTYKAKEGTTEEDVAVLAGQLMMYAVLFTQLSYANQSPRSSKAVTIGTRVAHQIEAITPSFGEKTEAMKVLALLNSTINIRS